MAIKYQKRVLIIAYYWPPAGGPGVQRWLKFTKYLPDFGVKPVVYVPENPNYPYLDDSLKKDIHPEVEVLKNKIIEPYRWAKLFSKKTTAHQAGLFEDQGKQSLASQVAIFVRGNFFIPDARMFWVKPSVKFLTNYLAKKPVDAVITTGPPHSMHLIGLGLKSKIPHLRWLADFRDPWTEISYHRALKITTWAKNKHEQLENRVLKQADAVLAASYSDAERYMEKGAKQTVTLLNGYDPEDFAGITKQASDKFEITYAGGLEEARNPYGLWKALEQLLQDYPKVGQQIRLNFVGKVADEIRSELKQKNFSEALNFMGYQPHAVALQTMMNADLLWLTNFPKAESKGIVPGKLFEYLATGNPVMAIGPEHADVGKILSKTNHGAYFTPNQIQWMKDFLLSQINKKGNKTSTTNVEQFSRRELTKLLLDWI